jgi:hypothetical protein
MFTRIQVSVEGRVIKSLRIFQWDTILVVVCIFVIMVAATAIYWLLYLMGYGTHPAGVWEAGLIFLGAAGTTLVVIVIILGGAIRYFLRKEIGLGLLRIAFCIILVLTWFMPLVFLRSDPFAQGFHSKVSSSVDVEELLIWADEQFRLPREDYTTRVMIGYFDGEGNPISYPEGTLTREPPDRLKELGPFYTLYFYTDGEGKQIVDIVWGGGFGHWGLRIGSSDLNQYNRTLDGTLLEWKPRLWVLGMHGG